MRTAVGFPVLPFFKPKMAYFYPPHYQFCTLKFGHTCRIMDSTLPRFYTWFLMYNHGMP